MVVTTVVDGSETFSFDILSSNITAQDAGKLLSSSGLLPVPTMPVNAYVIQDGERVILIDGGDANCMGTGGRLLEALTSASIEATDVDTILLTHAHPDHVGGLTTRGVPTFPNAELILHADELTFWQNTENFRTRPHLQNVRELACETFNAYQSAIRTVRGGEVAPGITLQHLPGHTPGHSGYLIQSGSEHVLIWGDIVHWPAIQIPRPDVTLAFDIDPVQMVRTRLNLLEQLSTSRMLVGGMHLNFPGLLRIHTDGDSFGFHEERWLPDLL